MTSLSALSTAYQAVTVEETVSGLPTDPTGNAVAFAFVLGRTDPTDDDWHDGVWDTEAVNGQYFANILVGPDGGAVTLTPGNWTMWVKVTDDPQTFIGQSGTVNVY